MNALRKGMLTLASILFIIFGVFSTLDLLVAADASVASKSPYIITVWAYCFAMSLAEAVIGIIGAMKRAKVVRSRFYIVSGIVTAALFGANFARVCLTISFQPVSLIGFITPILFIAGGIMGKKANPEPGSTLPRESMALSITAIAVVSVLAAAFAGLPFVNHTLTILSLKEVDDYPLYSMDYYGEYNLNYDVPNPKQTGIISQCTSFLAFNELGEPLFCRNFDDAFQSHPMAMLTTHRTDKHATIAMTDLFFMGYEPGHLPTGSLLTDQALLGAPRVTTDGMNEYGLAISYQGVPHMDPPYDPGKKSVDQTATMRLVLDHARNVDEAVDLIKSYNIVTDGTHYLIADAGGNSAIIEFMGGKVVVINRSEPWHTVTNFILSGDSHEGVGQDRYKAAEEELRARNGRLSADEAMELLRKVSQPGTHWSAVYNLKTGEVRLAMALKYKNILSFQLKMH